jgi:arylsulfatase A-like enzyme
VIRTSFAAFVAAAWYVCGVGVAPPDQRERAAPIRNVLVIMGDDHAAGVFGAYGNRRVRTPNLDRLAARGIRFDRAYTNSPVCTPARQ